MKNDDLITKIALVGKWHTESTGGWSDEDDWSRDSTYTEWYIDKVVRYEVASKSKLNILDTINTKHKGKCYLVYAIYSTGDSFGTDESANLELIWVFNDKNLAEKAKEEIVTNYESYKGDRLPCYIEIDKGEVHLFNTPWIGYFENLETVEIIEFAI